MPNDILNFTKQISGIDLVDYVINYIDQNMIAYSILKDMEFDVKTCVDGTCAIYDISNLSDSDMNLVKSLPEVQMVYLYDKVYNVSFSIEPEYNKLVITIMQVK
jgi:hypothetical protein